VTDAGDVDLVDTANRAGVAMQVGEEDQTPLDPDEVPPQPFAMTVRDVPDAWSPPSLR
jgi:hypothetical protein